MDKCPFCGSKYVNRLKTIETDQARETVYKCLNCKKEIKDVDEKKQASGTLLATFIGEAPYDSERSNWHQNDYIATLWRNESGELLCQLEYVCKRGKYGDVEKRKWVTSAIPTIAISDTAQGLVHQVCFSCNGSEPYAEKFRMRIERFTLNKELKDLALQNEFMRINDNERGCFTIFREREKVVKWLKQNLLPSTKKASGGCYIATCVYGSYNCPNVWVLRRYRDDVLSKTLLGRTFIKCYYAISPTIVRLFGNKKWFNALFKAPLDSIVKKLQSNGIDNTPYND